MSENQHRHRRVARMMIRGLADLGIWHAAFGRWFIRQRTVTGWSMLQPFRMKVSA